MKALVIHGAKDLRIEERAAPTPQQGEIRIRVAIGGICGSDLHYYHHAGFGNIRLKEPMIPGHEFSGYVECIGQEVSGFYEGQLVVISPSRPCRTCRFCAEGLYNHCLNMRFYGSAMPFPHIQGAFQEMLTVDASQCVPADGLMPGEAAMAEPLSVGLHATRRAGPMLGKRVLIAGCGPIGTLAIMAARQAGAVEIVAIDLEDNALNYAKQAGADLALNMAQQPDALQSFSADKGYFDVFYECSGSEKALLSGIAALRPKGIILQLGLGGDMAVPMMQITAKELEIRGSFRFHEEFLWAVQLMQSGRLDVKPVISHTLPFEQADTAFELAQDRSRAMKTQLVFAAA